MVSGVGPIPFDTRFPEQNNPDLAMRSAGDGTIKGTQNPSQPCASRFNRKESM